MRLYEPPAKEFFRLPNSIFHVPLDATQFKLYAYLVCCSGSKEYCWPTHKKIIQDTGIKKSSLQKAIKVLVKRKLIAMYKHRNPYGYSNNEYHMDYVRKQPLFNSQYRRWKFIAVCSAVDDDVKARYDSQKSKGKKGLVAEIDNYEVYALTWDDVFQSFDLRHAFLLDKLKMDEEAIAAEIAQTAGDEKSKDTADALTALVAN